MKKLIPIFVILLGWATAARAAPPDTLTTLHQITALSNGEGNRGYPVVFEATVTYSRTDENILFVQDDDVAVFVLIVPNTTFMHPGDRVQIKGKTAGSFNPIVISDIITVLHHGALPKAVPATFEQLIKAQYDCRLVSVRGMVRSADVRSAGNGSSRRGQLQMVTESGPVEVNLDTDDANVLSTLLDTEVEITGASAGKFDDKMQLTGTVLYVPSLANVKILARPGKSPWSVPITPLDKIFSVYNIHDLTPRVRVQGVITYYQPGIAIVLQDGSKSLWIETDSMQPLRIGDRAEAIGFTEERYRSLSLVDAEVLDSHVFTPIVPRPSTWKQLANWSANQPDGHSIDLVSIEGTVAAEVREDVQDEYVLISDGRLFTAIYHHPSATGAIPPMMMIPLGTKIRVTGICTRSVTRSVNPGYEVAFDILMRDFDDIKVVAKPSMLNIRNLVLLVCLLLAIVALVGGWGWNLEHKVRRQTAALAARERQRSRILVDINGSRPLDEILNKIVGMVSSMLDGAACWCELADGTTVGNCPQEPHSLEIIRVKIDSRSGPALGALLAAFGSESSPEARRTEALADGVRLATLAIETRRLYSDLRHRSEFDLLTEIPNRFAIEKRMNVLIEEAHQSSGLFGLIYIDLDEFKQVNDRYGHHIGDLYLQEVAVRMKRQLRGGDMLARLGGDEFAALVTVVHSRADVEEAVHRLQCCFETPFAVGEHTLWGEASIGIALYPEDGLTKDSLLSVADTAMYVVKNSRR